MTKNKTNIEEIKNEDYIKWVEDKLLLKTNGIETTMVRPVLYQVWSNVKALVAKDLHKRHADERWYHEYKQDIYRFVGDTVSDAMYMLDKVGALKAQNETLTPKDQVQAECEKPILKHIDERLKQHRDNLELWNNGTLTPTAEDEQDIELTKEGLKACIYELSELKDFIQKGAKGV